MSQDTTSSYLQNSKKPDLYIPDHILRATEIEQEESLFKRAAKDLGRFIATGDIITAPVHGVIAAGNEALKAADSIMNYAADKTGLPLNPYIQITDQDGNFAPAAYRNHHAAKEAGREPSEIPNVVEPDTTTGKLTSNAFQFLAGFIPALRGTKALGVVGKASKAAGLSSATTAGLEGAIAGAITDFAVFDPYQARLSNIIVEHGPESLTPFFDYLKAKDTDSELEGRLKQSAEGLGLGAVTSTLIHTFRTMRQLFTHTERIKAVTGQAYEIPDEILTTARELSLCESPETLAHLSSEWESIIKSDAWRELPEAAKKDIESILIRNPSLQFSDSLKEAITHDQAERQLYNEALVENAERLGADEAKKLDLSKLKAVDTSPLAIEVKGDKESLLSLSQHQFQAFKEALNAQDTETASKIIGRGINFKYIQTDDETKTLIKAIQELSADDINKATGNIRTWQETEAIASILGKDPANVQKNLSQMFETTQLMDGQVRAANLFLHSVFANLKETAHKADLGLLDEAGMLDFVRQQKLAEQTIVMFQGVKSNMARALNSLKMPVIYDNLAPGDIADLLKSAGGLEHQRRIAKLFAASDNPAAMAKMLRPTIYQRIRDAGIEYFINSILSGPTTHAVNVVSTAVNTVYQPLERIAGGIIGGDKSLIVEGANQYKSLVGGLLDIVKISSKGLKLNEDSPYVSAAKALWHDRNILDHNTSVFDAGIPPKAINAQGFGISPQLPLMQALEKGDYGQAFQASLAHALDFAGKVINLPSRFLTAEDEFFKVLNYRMEVRSQATRIVKEAAGRGEEIEGLFEKILADPSQFGIHETALDYARKATFTQPLRYGISQWMSQGTHRFSELKLILPFIRTPTNIIRFVHQRTPFLNFASREFQQELLSSDPNMRNLALGKLSMGWMLWATALSYSKEGRIQGGFANKPGVREAAENAGVLEYSFITTNKDGKKHYTQFNRLDPFGMFFSLAADMAEIMGQLDDKDADQLATGAVIAISRNLNARSYFTGLTNLLNALSQGDRYGARFIESYATALIPNFIKQTRKTSDTLWDDNVDPYKRITPAFRDLESLVQIMKSQLPGYSKDLPKALNIFGEELTYPVGFGPSTISPFFSSQEKDNPIAQEMFRLGMTAKPPSDRIGNVRLTPQQQHDYTKLSASPSENAKSLKDTLNTLLKSKGYQALSEGDEESEGTKQYVIKQIIAKYRAMGRLKLLEKYPTLKQEVIQDTFAQKGLSAPAMP